MPAREEREEAFASRVCRPAPERSLRQAVMRTRVRFGETDAAGIVYYPSYFAWFDSGTHELLRGDDPVARGAGGGPRYPLPIVEAGATFLAPLLFDEIIDIVSAVSELDERYVRVSHEIRTQTGTVVARGFEKRVFVKVVDGRLRRAAFPDDLRARLDPSVLPDKIG